MTDQQAEELKAMLRSLGEAMEQHNALAAQVSFEKFALQLICARMLGEIALKDYRDPRAKLDRMVTELRGWCEGLTVEVATGMGVPPVVSRCAVMTMDQVCKHAGIFVDEVMDKVAAARHPPSSMN